jgi:hypothetical protein
MDPQKVISVVSMYEEELKKQGVPKKRINPEKTFREATYDEILAHTHYLIDGVKEYAMTPGKEGKTGRHLASIQMCLSFAGWYTLEELMNHNRPT